MRFSSAELTFLLPLNNKRKLPQILRILQIITNKISDTRDICGEKNHQVVLLTKEATQAIQAL
jgi:hypothetical protein